MAVERGSVQFGLLGSLEARWKGEPLPLGGAKQRALLARLLVEARTIVSTDRLIDDLWGEQPPEQALHTVQVFVSRLRKALGPDVILTRAPGYLLEVPGDLIDAERFITLAVEAKRELGAGRPQEAAERFEQAFALWRGRPLADFAYQAWALEHAERLEEFRLSGLEQWTDARLALGRHSELVGELEQLVATHPVRERFRAQLMLALYRSGRQAEALDAYTRAREALVEQLGIDPSPQLQTLYRQLLNQDASLAAPAQGPSITVHNLPAPPNALIGRERELAELEDLLERPDVRLVTLTGAGGSGKTRVGLELARRLLSRFPDGVFFVELAAITDPELFAMTLAQALGVREQPPQPIDETLARNLRERQVLLVLDNFEQLLSAAPQLATLLARCEYLCALVTSRAALHLAFEHEYPVQPLGLPNMDQFPEFEQLSQSEAVALFEARARAVKPDFAVTRQNGASIAEICVRLDGLPLALELAATRVRALTPEAILARLGERLRLLTGGPLDHPERQQTLRAAIAWSYELLLAPEQTQFARLAVFRGATLEAIEAICADDEATRPNLPTAFSPYSTRT